VSDTHTKPSRLSTDPAQGGFRWVSDTVTEV